MRLNHFPDDESGNVEYKYKICKESFIWIVHSLYYCSVLIYLWLFLKVLSSGEVVLRKGVDHVGLMVFTYHSRPETDGAPESRKF